MHSHLTDQPLAGHFVSVRIITSSHLAHKQLCLQRGMGSDAASWMQSNEGRDTWDTLNVLNGALWSFFTDEGCRVVWESRPGEPSFVLAAYGARKGKWRELARINWLRGEIEDDEAIAWCEWLFLHVPAFQLLAADSRLRSRNSRGNVVEACIGASFLAAHELAAFHALAAPSATIPRFCFRTEPPGALAQCAALFSVFVHLGVGSPAWIPRRG